MPPANDGQVVNRDEIEPLLQGPLKRSGEWLLSFCPAHGDGTKHGRKDGQSLGLSDRGVLKCYAGCDFKSIMDALRGGRGPERAPTPIRANNEFTLRKVYEYRDRHGTLIAEKSRWETMGGSKTFKWRLPGATEWKGLEGMAQSAVPLYGSDLLDMQKDEPVWFVEGEKSCEACQDHGLVAVTGPGGAGQKDFGESLEVLRGRDVLLWADNDPPGRAHMIYVQSLLTGSANSIRWVKVDLGEKEDAADYFRKGGKVGQIEVVDPQSPIVTALAEDAVEVFMPTANGPVTWTFSDLDMGTRSFDATIECKVKESTKWPYEQRINMRSNSARTELRRDLESMYGKEYVWPEVINTAFSLAREWFLNQDRSVDLADIPDSMDEVLLIAPFICAEGPTIVFGDGSSLKSYLIWKMIAHVALGEAFSGFKVPLLRVGVIDYEDTDKNFKRRMKRVFEGIAPGLEPLEGMIKYWSPRGLPIADQVEALRRWIEKNGIGLVVVDSVAPALGADPSDPKAVLALFTALKRINPNLPVILIAHVTKGGDTMKPFGSVYWHNEARRTWYVERVQDEDSDDLDIGLYCRKVNDGQRPSPVAFHVHFDGRQGPVTVELGSIDSVPELQALTSAAHQVWRALEGSPLTIAQIMEMTSITDHRQVSAVLRKGSYVQAGMYEPPKGRPAQLWARRSDREAPEDGRAAGDHWH